MIGFGPQRLGLGVAVLALAVAGCVDVGLPGRNTPAAEQARKEWRYPLYQAATPADGVREIALRGTATGVSAEEPQHWLMSAEALDIPQNMLRPLGSAQGVTLYALNWASEPYSRLYAPASRAGAYHPLYPTPPVAHPPESSAH